MLTINGSLAFIARRINRCRGGEMAGKVSNITINGGIITAYGVNGNGAGIGGEKRQCQ